MNKPHTLIIFGAGSEKNLGFPTTQEIEEIFKRLFGFENGTINKYIPLRTRLEQALSNYFGRYSEENDKTYRIYKNLELTLRIMLDGNGAKSSRDAMEDREKALNEFGKSYESFMRDEYIISDNKKFSDNLYKIRYYADLKSFDYDWINMKALAYYLYKDQSDKFKLIDLLGILYNSKQSGISLPVPEYFDFGTQYDKKNSSDEWYNCNADKVFNAYKLILYKIYKGICYIKFSDQDKRVLNYYYRFIKDFIDRYTDNVKFVSFNWNPIFESLAYQADYRFNNSTDNDGIYYRYINHSALIDLLILKNFENTNNKDKIIPSFTENIEYFSKKLCDEPKSVKSIGFYPVHGTFNIRVCPKCSSVFMIYPKIQSELDIPEDFYNLFLIDPFPSKIDFKYYKEYPVLKEKLENAGGFGEISCPKCHTPVGFENTMLEIQTMFKEYSHFSLKSMLYGFAREFSKADKIIILGYSFPSDDIKDLLFLKAFRDINKNIKDADSKKRQKIYVVNYDKQYKDKDWMTLEKAKEAFFGSGNQQVSESLQNLGKLFNENDVRVSFQGVPQIFLNDSGEVNIDVFEED